MYLVIIMRAGIVFESFHHGNTKEVAEAMASAIGADLIRPGDRRKADLQDYDLIGFGSGIYGSKHHRDLIAFASRARFRKGARVFIFSTAGLPFLSGFWHRALRSEFEKKEISIAGDLCLPGYDTYAIFGLIGGINRGRPGEEDLERAARFARGIANPDA